MVRRASHDLAALAEIRLQARHHARSLAHRPRFQGHVVRLRVGDEPLVSREQPAGNAALRQQRQRVPPGVLGQQVLLQHFSRPVQNGAAIEACDGVGPHALGDVAHPERRPGADHGEQHASLAQPGCRRDGGRGQRLVRGHQGPVHVRHQQAYRAACLRHSSRPSQRRPSRVSSQSACSGPAVPAKYGFTTPRRSAQVSSSGCTAAQPASMLSAR